MIGNKKINEIIEFLKNLEYKRYKLFLNSKYPVILITCYYTDEGTKRLVLFFN